MIFANFKTMMHVENVAFYFTELKKQLNREKKHLAFFPSFTHLPYVQHHLADTNWALGAQNMADDVVPNYTGEITAELLKEQGVKYVLLGHAERRLHCKETNAVIRKKVEIALQQKLQPVVCIGENLSCKLAGRTQAFLRRQISAICKGLQESCEIIWAYEPIYAIGAKTSPKQEDIALAVRYIQRCMAKYSNISYKILYGGSVSASTAHEILQIQGVDGLLLGRAGTKVEELVSIVRAYESK